MNEAEIRAELIDPKLKACGWGVVAGSRILREHDVCKITVAGTKLKQEMEHNPVHNRKSIRLKEYDYSQAGWYFVTICCKDKKCLFGKIENGKMRLNNAGEQAHECWVRIPNYFPNNVLHEYIIMPNHVHGIIEITTGGANNHSPNKNNYSPDDLNNRAEDFPPLRSPSKTIGSMVRGYKAGVTKWFRMNMNDLFPVGQAVWQRNYYEHIIRNEKSLNGISEYIMGNPQNWENDEFYT